VAVKDFDQEFKCRECGAPVRIRVRKPARASSVLAYWEHTLKGKCRRCVKRRAAEEMRGAMELKGLA